MNDEREDVLTDAEFAELERVFARCPSITNIVDTSTRFGLVFNGPAALAWERMPDVLALVRRLREENERLREGYRTIRRDYGHVCPEFETCDHAACRSSLARGRSRTSCCGARTTDGGSDNGGAG